MKILKKTWIEIVIGTLIGFFILHPISMFLAQGKDGLLMFFHHDFSHMLLSKMSWYFTVLGVLLGLISGVSRVKLHSKNILLAKQKRDILITNAKLEQQNEEIQTQAENLKSVNEKIVLQNDKIKKQNEDIAASINYARRIQNAILPDDELIKTTFKDIFILYKPKSIVSGDFYWVAEKGAKIFIAAVDCTGHGVPGAFMSIIGKGIMDKIVNELNISEPDEILFQLDVLVRQFLKQNISKNKDGMDIALCVVDKEQSLVKFAGAKNPLVIVQNNTAEIIKGNRISIGGYTQKEKPCFTCHKITIPEDMMLYIFSDGFQDQFGGEDNSKFKKKRMLHLFSEVASSPLNEQKYRIEQEFENWKGNKTQIDDVLIIGFKL